MTSRYDVFLRRNPIKSIEKSQRRTRRTRDRRMFFEPLESRALLATLDFTGSLLEFHAEAGVANQLVLTAVGTTGYQFDEAAEQIDDITNLPINCTATAVPANSVTINCLGDDDIDSLAIQLDDGADSFVLRSATDPIDIQAGSENDSIEIGDAANSLDGITGAVTIDGNAHDGLPVADASVTAGAVTITSNLETGDRVVINDVADTDANVYTINDGVLTRGTANISFVAVESLEVVAGVGADTIDILSTLEATTTTISTSSGGDDVTVTTTGQGSTLQLVGDIQANTFVVLGTGDNSITEMDAGLGDDELQLLGNGVGSGVALRGDAGRDTLSVHASSAGSATLVDGGEHSDTFNIGNAANSLDDILGTVEFLGGDHEVGTTVSRSVIAGATTVTSTLEVGDTLTFNDQGTATSLDLILSPANLLRSGLPSPILYSGTETILINAGTGADVIEVIGTVDSTRAVLNTTAGGDSVRISGSGVSSIIETFGDIGTNTFEVTATGASSVTIMNAAGGNDSLLQIANGTSSGVALNGDAGQDSLTIQSSAMGSATRGDGGTNSDTGNIGNAANSLDGILGTVEFLGGGHDLGNTLSRSVAAGPVTVTSTLEVGDSLTFNDHGTATDKSLTLAAATLQRSGTPQPIHYSLTETIGLNAGTGKDSIEVVATVDQTRAVINTTAGGDTVRVTSTGTSSILETNADAGINTLEVAMTGTSSVTILNAAGGNDSLLQIANGTGSGVALNGDAGQDSLTIQSSATASATRGDGGTNSDTGNIGNTANSLDGILGTVEFLGGDHDLGNTLSRSVTAGAVTVTSTLEVGDSLTFNDHGTAADKSLTLAAATLQRSGTPQPIHYSLTETIGLNAGTGKDSIDVAGTSSQTRTAVNTTAGGDTVRVTNTGTSSILETNADAGINTLEVAMTGTSSVTILNAAGGNDSLLQTANGTSSGVALNGDAGQDSLTIQSSATASATRGDGGANSDTGNIGNTANSLDGILGTVEFLGGDHDLGNTLSRSVTAGSVTVTSTLEVGDSLTFNDHGTAADKSLTLAAATLQRSGTPQPIHYSLTETIGLNAGTGKDSIDVAGTSAQTRTAVNTTAGGDTVRVTNTGTSSILETNADAGINTLEVAMTGTSSVTIVNAAGGSDSLLQIGNGTGSGVALHGDAGQDSLTIRSSATASATRGDGGANSDTGNIGNAANSLDGILGTVEFLGGDHDLGNTLSRSVTAGTVTVATTLEVGDSLSLNDQGTDANKNLTLSEATLQRSGTPQPIFYSLTETLSLNAGTGTDTIDVTSTAAQTRTTLNTTGGGDSVRIANSGDASILETRGDGGGNSLEVRMTGNGSVTLLDAGGGNDSLVQMANGANSGVALRGDAGEDEITVLASATGSATLASGGADNDINHAGNATSSLDPIIGTVEFVGGENGAQQRNLAILPDAQVPQSPYTVDSQFNPTATAAVDVGDAFLINDGAKNSGQNYAIQSAIAGRIGGESRTLHYREIETIQLTGGAAADEIDVELPSGGTQLPDVVVVNGGGGSDNLVRVNGQSGAQRVVIDSIRSDAAGRTPIEIANARRLNVFGSNEGDVYFSRLDASSLAGGSLFEGGEGDDVLCSASNQDLLLGGPGTDFLCSTGGNTILMPDHRSEAGVLVPFNPPQGQDGDLVKLGADDTALPLGADVVTGINRNCGTITLTGAFQIDVLCWLYARFQTSLPPFDPNNPTADPAIRYQAAIADVVQAEPEAGDWHNALQNTDVNSDGLTTPFDALLVINNLNAQGSRRLTPPLAGEAESAPRIFYDVTNDGYLTPADALVVINALGRLAGGGEGEGEGEGTIATAGERQAESAAVSLGGLLSSVPRTSMSDRVLLVKASPTAKPQQSSSLQTVVPTVDQPEPSQPQASSDFWSNTTDEDWADLLLDVL